jgi:hypothetical protein
MRRSRSCRGKGRSFFNLLDGVEDAVAAATLAVTDAAAANEGAGAGVGSINSMSMELGRAMMRVT